MINRIKDLTSSQGFRSTGIMTFGNLTGTAISAIAMILISRFLGPEEFGVFSSAFSLLLLLNTIADLGINLASQRYMAKTIHESKQKAQSMMHTMFFIRTTLYLAIALFGIFLSPILSQRLLKIQDPTLVRYAFLLSFLPISFEYFLNLAQTLQEFQTAAFMTIIQAIGKLIGVVLLYFLNLLNSFTAFLAYAIMPAVGALYGFLKTRITPWQKPKFLRQDLQVLKTTAVWTGLALISARIADHFDVLLVKNMLDSYQTGLFSAASRISSFAALLGISAGMVLNIRVARYKKKKHLDKYLKKARLASLAMFLVILASTPFAHYALLLTVGREYLSATIPLSLLLISSAFTSATSPFVALFYLFEKPQYYAYSGILLLIILIGGDLIFIPKLGIVGASLVKIVTRFLVFLFTIIYAKKAYAEQFAQE